MHQDSRKLEIFLVLLPGCLILIASSSCHSRDSFDSPVDFLMSICNLAMSKLAMLRGDARGGIDAPSETRDIQASRLPTSEFRPCRNVQFAKHGSALEPLHA